MKKLEALVLFVCCLLLCAQEKEGAFIVGASYGRGVITCRSGEGFRGPPWSAPAMLALKVAAAKLVWSTNRRLG